MSNFNINDISYLYEHINNQTQFALDAESEYYDQELAEAVEDVISTISINMISSGHTAEGVVDFLKNAPEQDILEYYLNPPVISENSVSEEFVLQELARLEEGIGAVVSGLKLLGKGAMKAAAPVVRTATVAAKRMAGPGVRKAIGGAVSKVKDIATKVAPKLPGIAKGALLAGAGVGAGYLGAKLTGGRGRDTKPAPKGQTVAAAGGKGGKVTVGREYDAVLSGKKGKVTYSQSGEKFFKQTQKDAPKPASNPTSSTPGSGTPGSGKPQGSKPSSTPQKPKAPMSDREKYLSSQDYKDDMKASADADAAYKASSTPENKAARDRAALKIWGKSNSKMIDQYGRPEGRQILDAIRNNQPINVDSLQRKPEKDAEEFRKMINRSKQRQGELMGGPEGPGKIDTKSVEADIKAAQEREKTKASTKKESYDAFDLVLEYLFETDQVETLTEATYVMMEMDSEAIQAIVESKAGFLLEEFDAIVNGLIEEGYDLSEYTEEELIDIFVAENILPAMAKLIVGINKARQLAGPTVKLAKNVAKVGGHIGKEAAKTVYNAGKAAGAVVKGASKGGALAKTATAGKGGALVKSSGGALAKTPKSGALVSTGVNPVNVRDLGTSAAKAAKGAGGAAAGGAAAGAGGRGGALVASPGGALTKGGKAGALVAPATSATPVATPGQGGRGGKAGLLAAGLLGAGALGAGMLVGREKKEPPRRKEGLVGSQNAKKPLTATDTNMKTAADVNKQGGIALGKGGLGYLAKKGDKMVIKQARAVGADDGVIGRAARAFGLTRAKDKAIEAQRQAKGRSNREKYLAGQELTDPNITGYQAKGAIRKGKPTGTKIKMDNNS